MFRLGSSPNKSTQWLNKYSVKPKNFWILMSIRQIGNLISGEEVLWSRDHFEGIEKNPLGGWKPLRLGSFPDESIQRLNRA